MHAHVAFDDTGGEAEAASDEHVSSDGGGPAAVALDDQVSSGLDVSIDTASVTQRDALVAFDDEASGDGGAVALYGAGDGPLSDDEIALAAGVGLHVDVEACCPHGVHRDVAEAFLRGLGRDPFVDGFGGLLVARGVSHAFGCGFAGGTQVHPAVDVVRAAQGVLSQSTSWGSSAALNRISAVNWGRRW
ncbi:hypothetical protein [Nesterenkonia pannonica]|uniref:hypothetical protein n=1 Tax=Nesterenkonia pannonica TaxID=1548602 RepID=UPI0021640AA3|nr:hypothetical protein [Nesterenkonia pannonica]